MFTCPLIRLSGTIYAKMVKYETYIFGAFVLISLLQLWLTKYVPSLDGPQHLYNASVLANMVRGNELVQTFFTINETLVGYWTAHGLLAFFTFFLPAWLAEKLFLTVYVLGVIFSFRYLVKSLYPDKGNFVQYLIFPFVFHMFILLGYYAFSFATIFYFIGFGYFIRNRDQLVTKKLLIFAGLLVLLFLTHGLVYLFFLISLAVYFIVTAVGRRFTESKGGWLKETMLKSGKILLAALPSLIMWVLYIRTVIAVDSTVAGPAHSIGEMVKFLTRIRQLVGFHHELEAIGYVPVFILIVLLSVVFLLLFVGRLRDRSGSWSELLNSKNSWIFLAVFFLGLYFFAPNRISAGTINHRFGLYFFLMVITWLSLQKWPKTFQVLTVVVVLFSMIYTRTIHHYFYEDLNIDIVELSELTEYMQADRVVNSKVSSDNWIHTHFPLYGMLDKPLVHLRNAQCYGQFPMVWNYDEMPRTYAGDQPVRPYGSKKLAKDHPVRQIDYYTVFYMDRFWNDTTESKWHRILEEEYEEVHVSGKGKAGLYRKK